MPIPFFYVLMQLGLALGGLLEIPSLACFCYACLHEIPDPDRVVHSRVSGAAQVASFSVQRGTSR